MTRKFILCHLLTVIASFAGCASEDSAPFGVPADTSSSPDATGDGGPTLPDTVDVDTDTRDVADTLDAPTGVDVGTAPDHVATQVPCNVVKTLTCGETVSGASNGGEGSTKVLGWYACQPEVKAHYAASPETTYQFVADADVRVTVTESADTSVDLFAIKDEGAGAQRRRQRA